MCVAPVTTQTQLLLLAFRVQPPAPPPPAAPTCRVRTSAHSRLPLWCPWLSHATSSIDPRPSDSKAWTPAIEPLATVPVEAKGRVSGTVHPPADPRLPCALATTVTPALVTPSSPVCPHVTTSNAAHQQTPTPAIVPCATVPPLSTTGRFGRRPPPAEPRLLCERAPTLTTATVPPSSPVDFHTRPPVSTHRCSLRHPTQPPALTTTTILFTRLR